MVFYRKYRPQKISELDNQLVREKLSAILSGKTTPHAFLFTGPKGLGKTSTARILAKGVNCEKKNRKSGSEPCNSCSQCISITQGNNLDVLEIDAASNRGIDEIRDLRDKINLAPSGGSKKVYIIDEVHMLTTEAFNALLKMLEEPPDHAIFVLCTTDPHKVPPTIQSRCFPIAFTKAVKVELVRSLTRIIKEEKIHIDNDGLSEIAKVSDGSFRDAVKLLELAVLTSGRKKITKDVISTLSGRSMGTIEFMEFLLEKDAKGALIWIGDSVNKGLNIKLWLEDLIISLHDSLLSRYGIENNETTDAVEGFTKDELKNLIALFTRAHGELKTSVIAQLPVELVVIEYCIEEKL